MRRSRVRFPQAAPLQRKVSVGRSSHSPKSLTLVLSLPSLLPQPHLFNQGLELGVREQVYQTRGTKSPTRNTPITPLANTRPAMTAGIFGIVQATLAAVITNWSVELHAVHLDGLVGIAILASLTFIAVNQACIAMLGYRGRFVSIVLLLIQIAAMGATFPVETMPAFFNWIHPFLPTTYTQLSFRAMVAGSGVPGIVSKTILVLLLWLVIAAFFVLLGAYLRTKNHPLPHDAALLPDNTPDEDQATPAELAARKDLKTEVREHQEQLVSAVAGTVAAARTHPRPHHQRPRGRGIIAGSNGTMGTVGPRSEVYTYRDQDVKPQAPDSAAGPDPVQNTVQDRVRENED